ncbi:hypothetical protein ACFPRL_05025 [Pseudoclavibacter helvolus]
MRVSRDAGGLVVLADFAKDFAVSRVDDDHVQVTWDRRSEWLCRSG